MYGTSRRTPRRADAGQVAPLVAVIVLATGAALVGLVAIGAVLVDRATARTAADAAALAGALGDDEDAHRAASANGAELVGLTRHGDAVEVEVRVGRVSARARAEAVREVVPPGRGDPRPPIP